MKHTNKRILSFVLSALMLLSLLPAGILAGAVDAMNAENTVYVDQSKGSDSNNGTESNPVKTIEKAVALLEAGDKTADGYIYLVGDYTAVYDCTETSQNISLVPVHTRHIIITGDSDSKPTWTVKIHCSTLATYMDVTADNKMRQGMNGVRYLNNGPLTLDFIKMYSTVDETNAIIFPQDIEYTFKDTHANEKYKAFAGYKFVFKQGEPL